MNDIIHNNTISKHSVKIKRGKKYVKRKKTDKRKMSI